MTDRTRARLEKKCRCHKEEKKETKTRNKKVEETFRAKYVLEAHFVKHVFVK